MKNNFKKIMSLTAVFTLMALMTFITSSFTDSSELALSSTGIIVAGKQIHNEKAEKEMIKQFRHDGTWMSELQSKNGWVNNDVIKIPKQGAAPNVLINNTVYPIKKNNIQDDHVVLSLNKYETENETVTDDELYALPYEKVSTTQTKHRETLEDKTEEHAIWSIAPDKATDSMPILETTGDDDGTGRKRLTTKDIIAFKNL